MKTFFLSLLIISTLTWLCLSPNHTLHFPFIEVSLSLPATVALKVFLILLNMLFIYCTTEEAREKKLLKKGKFYFFSGLKKYISKKGQKIDNLLVPYPEQIYPGKDLYYIEGALVLKTKDVFKKKYYTPQGLTLDMGSAQFMWLKTSRFLLAVFHARFICYWGLLAWSLLIISRLLH